MPAQPLSRFAATAYFVPRKFPARSSWFAMSDVGQKICPRSFGESGGASPGECRLNGHARHEIESSRNQKSDARYNWCFSTVTTVRSSSGVWLAQPSPPLQHSHRCGAWRASASAGPRPAAAVWQSACLDLSSANVWPSAVACSKCDRRGQYPVARLIERYGAEAKLVDWKDQITAACPRRTKASVAVLDQCGAHLPELLKLQI